MKQTCWNCLHEYACDWEKAGDNDHCSKWEDDGRVARNTDMREKSQEAAYDT